MRRIPESVNPCTEKFKGLFKLRVGGYRVIFALFGRGVVGLRIRHRSHAYGQEPRVCGIEVELKLQKYFDR